MKTAVNNKWQIGRAASLSPAGIALPRINPRNNPAQAHLAALPLGAWHTKPKTSPIFAPRIAAKPGRIKKASTGYHSCSKGSARLTTGASIIPMMNPTTAPSGTPSMLPNRGCLQPGWLSSVMLAFPWWSTQPMACQSRWNVGRVAYDMADARPSDRVWSHVASLPDLAPGWPGQVEVTSGALETVSWSPDGSGARDLDGSPWTSSNSLDSRLESRSMAPFFGCFSTTLTEFIVTSSLRAANDSAFLIEPRILG